MTTDKPNADEPGTVEPGTNEPNAGEPGTGERVIHKAEFFVSGLLALLGTVVLTDALTMATLSTASEVGPIGPRAVPIALGVGLLICAVVHIVDVLRGGRGEAEAGEDVDLDAPLDWRAILLITAFFLANAVLIEPLGWAISGAILFWGTAYALGSRSYLRDAAISVVLSVGSFYAFAYGLGMVLPPGVLKGIL